MIEVYHREGCFWAYRTYAAGEECLLESLDIRFTVAAVYDRTGVPLSEEPETNE